MIIQFFFHVNTSENANQRSLVSLHYLKRYIKHCCCNNIKSLETINIKYKLEFWRLLYKSYLCASSFWLKWVEGISEQQIRGRKSPMENSRVFYFSISLLSLFSSRQFANEFVRCAYPGERVAVVLLDRVVLSYLSDLHKYCLKVVLVWKIEVKSFFGQAQWGIDGKKNWKVK